MMNDEELLAYVETKVHAQMLDGCVMDDHLGREKYDTGSWVVCLRADLLGRLIDMAKKGV
jgi:hypothetical protein